MLDSGLTEEELWSKIPSLSFRELPAFLEHPTTKERHLLKLLERTDLPESFLAQLSHSKWVRSVRVQFSLVNHAGTPLADAMNFVKFLAWRDLNLTIQNFHIASEVRHAAETVLLQRIPAMAVGEKITFARTAAGQALKMLRNDKDPRVVKALLENGRTVEDDVLFLINQPKTPAPVLETVARDPKWSARQEVRVGLIRNMHTPLAAIIPFLSSLNLAEARALSQDPKVPVAVRRMLLTRLGRKP
ncbi:MAG: hypothetical protein ACP5VF_03135 [Acidobacteriota bacterium]